MEHAAAMKGRIAILALVVTAIFALLIWRLADTQLRNGAYYDYLANLNQLRTIPQTAPRGLLYDRNGIVIARNRPSFVVQVVPMQLRDPVAEMRELSSILSVPDAALWRRLLYQNGVTYKSFDDLAAAIPLGPLNVAEDLNTATVGRFAERADELTGMSVELVPVREYPFGTLASHAIGYVGQISQAQYTARKSQGYGPNDTIGEEGLEMTYDALLRGQRGGKQIKVNSAGEAVASVGEYAAVPGLNLDLTIDWPLQRAAETAMAIQIKAIAKRIGHRVGGSAIVEDPSTGAVLALVSQPNFDPNDFAAGISQKRYAGYLNDPLLPLFDRAVSGAYPTGSTFKMITSSAALQSGLLTGDSTRYCGGAYDLNGYIFNDDLGGGHGTLTIRPAIARSCDVFFYQVGNQVGINRLDKYAGAFGIGKKSGIDLPGETSGTLPTPAWKKQVVKDEWYSGDTVDLSIGQGFLEASPVQMLRVVSAVANGGELYAPYFVNDARDVHGHIVKRFSPRDQGRVPVSPQNLSIVREGMLGAIEDPYGTAHNVYMPGFHYAGKTGTAENFPTVDNPQGRNHAWFVCFAPYDRPRIAVVVFIDQSGGFGAVNAAPVAQAIVASYFRIRAAGPNGSGIRD
jgi:penicillin-binding protein 2